MTPARAKRALLTRLEQLGCRIAGVPELAAGADPVDRAVQSAQQDDEAVLRGRYALEIAGINAALARIEGGEYGICALCGDPIPPARLDARPESVHCVRCAEARERYRGPIVRIADDEDQC